MVSIDISEMAEMTIVQVYRISWKTLSSQKTEEIIAKQIKKELISKA